MNGDPERGERERGGRERERERERWEGSQEVAVE